MPQSPLLPNDARVVTLPLHSDPAMLTEYAPGAAAVTIVNTGGDRVWIAGTSSVGPASGVPLDGGASLPWRAPGQVWAVLDAAAKNPVTLYVTSAIGSWTPSPVAVASATAAQLLATGVPTVLTGQILYGPHTPIPSGTTQTIDVSTYGSLNVTVAPGGSPDTLACCSYQFTDTTGAVVLDHNTLSTTGTTQQVNYRLPVSGPRLQIAGTNSSPLVTIYGSNRTLTEGSVVAPFAMRHFKANTTMTILNYYPMLDELNLPQSVFNGLIIGRARLTGSTPRGRFLFTSIDGSGNPQGNFEYTSYEMVQQSGATDLTGTFQFAHPRGGGYWQFYYEGTTGNTLDAELWLSNA